MKATTASRTGLHRWIAGGLCAGVAVAAFALAGCSESDGNAVSSDPLAPAIALETGADSGPPSFEDLNARLNLNPDQTGPMQSLLADWSAKVAERREQRGERRFGDGENGRAGRPGRGHEGRRGRRGSGASGEFSEPPHLDFLVGAAGILDNSQMISMAEFMAERRMEHMSARRNSSGPDARFAGRHGRERGARFGLNEEESSALRDARKTHREGMRELMSSYADGAITAEAVRDGAAGLNAALESSARAALGEEGFAKLSERRAEMESRKAERRLEHLGSRQDRHVGVLEAILNLDPAQTSNVRGALAAAEPRWATVLGGVKDGSMAPEEMLYQSLLIRDETKNAVRGTLGAEQAALFDAMQKLLPGRGHGGR